MSRVDGHGLGANDLVEMAQINRASCGKWRGLRTRTSGHQIRNEEIRRDRYVEEVEDMGTDRAAGRHSSTMRRAIGARTPSVEVPPLGAVHQYRWILHFRYIFAFDTRHCCGLTRAALALADAASASPLMTIQWPNAAAVSSDGVFDAEYAPAGA